MDDIATLTTDIAGLNSIWNDLADKATNAFQIIYTAVLAVKSTIADTVVSTNAMKESLADFDIDLELKVDSDEVKESVKLVEELNKKIKQITSEKHRISVSVSSDKGLTGGLANVLSTSKLNPVGLLKTGAEKFAELGKKDALPEDVQGVYDKGTKIVDDIGSAAGKVLSNLMPFFNNVLSVGQSFQAIIPQMVTALTPLTDAINAIPIKELLDPFIQLLPQVVSLFMPLVDLFQALPIKELVKDIASFAGIIISNLTPILKSLMPILSPILGIIASLARILIDRLGPAFNFIGTVIGLVGKGLSMVLAPILAYINQFFGKIADTIHNVAEKINGVINAVSSFFSDDKDVSKNASDTKKTVALSTNMSSVGVVPVSPVTTSLMFQNQAAVLPQNVSKALPATKKAKRSVEKTEGSFSGRMYSSDASREITVNITAPLIGNFNIQTKTVNDAHDKIKQEILSVLHEVFNRATPTH